MEIPPELEPVFPVQVPTGRDWDVGDPAPVAVFVLGVSWPSSLGAHHVPSCSSAGSVLNPSLPKLGTPWEFSVAASGVAGAHHVPVTSYWCVSAHVCSLLWSTWARQYLGRTHLVSLKCLSVSCFSRSCLVYIRLVWLFPVAAFKLHLDSAH